MNDKDTINNIWNELEDYLVNIKEKYDLNIDFEIIDSVIENTIEVAKNRELHY